jgi:hypothetical protein
VGVIFHIIIISQNSAATPTETLQIGNKELESYGLFERVKRTHDTWLAAYEFLSLVVPL